MRQKWPLWVVGMIWSSMLIVGLPAEAASYCRAIDGHRICILAIKRSAKNYWEYRASVQVDGVERSPAVYDCRDRLRTESDGTVAPFEPAGAGELICKLLDR
jgi:hypothetical protein